MFWRFWKSFVGRKILVFVHYGVGWILRLDFESVREIIWRNSVWESFRSCWVEKLCPSKKFVVHSFARLYGGQKLLTKWFWAKSASRFPCQELQALDGGQDGRVRQEGSNAKRKKRVRSSSWAIEHVHRIYEASVVMLQTGSFSKKRESRFRTLLLSKAHAKRWGKAHARFSRKAAFGWF